MFLAIRDVFLGKELGFEEPFKALEFLGLKSIELHVTRELGTIFGSISTSTSRKKLLEELSSRGIGVCAILVENDFGARDVRKEIEYICKACEVCPDLNCKVVRINAFMRPVSGLSMRDYVIKSTEYIRECLRVAEEYDVSIAMENHGLIGNNREFIRELINEVSSERFGLTLDSGNFYWYGYPLEEVYAIIEEFAPHVKHTHIKNFEVEEGYRDKPRLGLGIGRIRGAPIYAGDIDMRRVLSLLRKGDYDHDTTIEDESLHRFDKREWKEILRRDADHLRKILEEL